MGSADADVQGDAPGLAELAAWLVDAGVTLVGMEATGVYWKTVFQALETRFECWLLNAHHLRNVSPASSRAGFASALGGVALRALLSH